MPLNSAGLEFLDPDGVALLLGDTINIPLNWKLRFLPGHFEFLVPSIPDYQGETGLFLHNGDKEECVWSIGDPLGCLLVLPWSVVKVNVKLKQHISGRMTKGLDLRKVGITPPGK